MLTRYDMIRDIDDGYVVEEGLRLPTSVGLALVIFCLRPGFVDDPSPPDECTCPSW